ncbi:ATP-grasp domain-containing protein, partial [Streptomyces calidiresistens]
MAHRVRVWLNRTYAENVFFIDQLRLDPRGRGVEVHATHPDPDSPVRAAADVSGGEPEGLGPAAYAEWALDRCARHAIDVFVPRLHQDAVAARAADFAAVGTALLTPPAEAVRAFRDKATAYEALSRAGLPVPPWWRVRTEEELLTAVGEIEAAGDKACFKPADGTGGEGFRVITRTPFSLLHLTGYPGPYVPLDLVRRALRRAEAPVNWLVMPRLDEPETSVDLLTGPDGGVRMAVGRTKLGRRRGFTLDPAVIEPARALAERFGLHFLSNVQFRLHRGRPVLLDINTRPAGGLHQLSRCGLNVPAAAVRLALGEDPGTLTPRLPADDYATVATPRPLAPR